MIFTTPLPWRSLREKASGAPPAGSNGKRPIVHQRNCRSRVRRPAEVLEDLAVETTLPITGNVRRCARSLRHGESEERRYDTARNVDSQTPRGEDPGQKHCMRVPKRQRDPKPPSSGDVRHQARLRPARRFKASMSPEIKASFLVGLFLRKRLLLDDRNASWNEDSEQWNRPMYMFFQVF